MNRNQRPLSVTILGCLYVAVGIIGFAYHFNGLLARNAFQQDVVWAELTEFLAILSGVFMLQGKNWARWLALAWIVFHVVLSAFHALPEFGVHLLFCAVIAWVLFHREAERYFRGARAGSPL